MATNKVKSLSAKTGEGVKIWARVSKAKGVLAFRKGAEQEFPVNETSSESLS